MDKLRRYKELVFIYFFVLALFYKGLFNFFFQDDFIHFTLGWIRSPQDFLKLFQAIPHFPYRPIAIQILSAIELHIFQLNPFIGHLILFWLFGINIFLLWKILSHFVDKRVRFLITFLYATSSTHFMLLYWWSILYMLLGTAFVLTSFLILIGVKRRISHLKTLSLIALFLLMVVTNEALIVFPAVVTLYAILFNKNLFRKVVIPLLLSLLFLLPLRFLIAKYPESSDYALGSFFEVIKTFQWYVLRSVNLTEGIRAMNPFLQKISLILLSLLFILFMTGFIKTIKDIKNFNKRLFIFGICWFVLFGAPFFLLPHHLSPYYLNTALIGFLTSEVTILENIIQRNSLPSRAFLTIFIILYGLLSIVNVDYLNKTHWVVWRAEIARIYIEKTLKTYPLIPKGSTILFQNTTTSPSEIAVVLSGERALTLYYKDPTLRTIYSKELINKKNVYIVTD